MRVPSLRRQNPRFTLFAVALAAIGAGAAGGVALAGNGRPGPVIAPKIASPNFVGTVVDNATKRPISGATVALFYARPRVGTSPFCPSCYADCQKREKTDPSGRFRIAAPDRALLFTVLVVRDGYAPRFFPDIDPGHGAAAFSLTPKAPVAADPSHRVLGRIVDASGNPVEGAILQPNGVAAGEQQMLGAIDGVDPMAVSNHDGSFAFQIPHADDSLTMTIDARGFAPRVSGWIRAGKAPVTLRLGTGASLVGRVVDPSGKPIRGVVFEATQTEREVEQFVGAHYIGTTANGEFSLANVLPGAAHIVCVHGSGPLSAANLAVPKQTITTPADGRTMPLGAIRAIPAVTLSGRIVLPPGKTVPAGRRLLLGRDGTWDAQQTVVAPDGTFAFRGIPPGEAMSLTVRLKGYQIAKDTPGLDKDNPQFGSIQFTAPAVAGPMPAMTITMLPK